MKMTEYTIAVSDMINWGPFEPPSGYKGDWNTQYIYALTEPLLGIVRYVGRTQDPKSRLIRHVCGRASNADLGTWISTLREHGLLPGMVILDSCDYLERDAREQEWIDRMVDDEEALLN